MVVFDATMMLLLMRPNISAPLDPATGLPVEHAEIRINSLVSALDKSRTRIIVPAPALSELLVRAGGAGNALIETIQKSSLFHIAPFDTLAAIEVAEMTRAALDEGGKRENADGTWAKIKYDRQIIAIARINKAETIYSDDNNIHAFGKKMNLRVLRLADLPLPPESAQKTFDFSERTNANE